MKRLLFGALALSGCGVLQPQSQPQPARVDTLVVTREVEPALPEAAAVKVCLSTGVTAEIYVTASGDTLIGEKRAKLSELRPAVTFAGTYAGDRTWHRRGDVVKFEGRDYRRAGIERVRECDELKLVGDHDGVPIFAEVTAAQPLGTIIIPVRAGIYQDYLRVRR